MLIEFIAEHWNDALTILTASVAAYTAFIKSNTTGPSKPASR